MKQKQESKFYTGMDLDDRAIAMQELLDRLESSWREAIRCNSLDSYATVRDDLKYTLEYVHYCDRDDALEIEGYVEEALTGRLPAAKIADIIEEAIMECRLSLEELNEKLDRIENAIGLSA